MQFGSASSRVRQVTSWNASPRFLPASNPRRCRRTGVALKLTFPGSNPDVRLEPINPLTTTVSYFLGNDPTQWQPDVPVYTGVRYVDLYPGVNLVLGGSDGAWQLEAAPDAAVDQVRLLVEGALIEDLDGTELHLARDDERLSVALPRASFTYQVEGVSTQGETLALEFRPDPRTRRQPIAPDDNPQDLVFGTFLGSDERDLAYTLAVDETGQSTVAGYTQSSAFPTTPGAFDPSFNGALGFYDAFVARLSADGSTLVYGTFLGGSSNEIAYGIAVDNSGEATVTGLCILQRLSHHSRRFRPQPQRLVPTSSLPGSAPTAAPWSTAPSWAEAPTMKPTPLAWTTQAIPSWLACHLFQ